MFSSLIKSIEKGELPELSGLRKKFDFALVKKMGIVSLPYHFWQTDPKINPPSSQLLWAAILLGDRNAVVTVVGIIQKEMEEAAAASSSKNSRIVSCARFKAQIILCDDLLLMAPTKEFREILATIVRRQGSIDGTF